MTEIAEKSTTPVLALQNVTTTFKSRHRGTLTALTNVSLSIERGEIFALVGESGCGKTLTALTIMRLLPRTAEIVTGKCMLDGRDLFALREKEMRRERGKSVSMIFQEPMTSLDPCYSIGHQVVEAVRAHQEKSMSDAKADALEMLERVRIPDAKRRFSEYPHEFSGGMRQRVMLAIALVLRPHLLIADEPTTALDVTIQAEILELIQELRAELGMSVLLITHNFGVVSTIADRVGVMYAGEVVEEGRTRTVLDTPRHPYSQGLLDSIPTIGRREARLAAIPGRVPELWSLPTGCRFAPRCSRRLQVCDDMHPDLNNDAEHLVRCFNPVDV